MRKATVSFVMSVRLSTWNNSAPTGRIFIQFYFRLFETLWTKFNLHLSMTKIRGTLLDDRYTFLISSRSVLLRLKNISDKFYRESKHESYFDVLLTVHLSVFISVFNQLDAQNLFHNKFYFMPLHVSSTCSHHQEVKIALHSLWYHHTYRWPSRARVERGCVMQFWPPDGEHMCSKHV